MKSSVGSAILVKIRCVLIYDRYDYEVAIGLQRFWKTNEKDTGVNHVQKACSASSGLFRVHYAVG